MLAHLFVFVFFVFLAFQKLWKQNTVMFLFMHYVILTLC